MFLKILAHLNSVGILPLVRDFPNMRGKYLAYQSTYRRRKEFWMLSFPVDSLMSRRREKIPSLQIVTSLNEHLVAAAHVPIALL